MGAVIEQLTDVAGPAIVAVDFAQFSDDETVAKVLARSMAGHSVYLADPVAAMSVTPAGLGMADLAGGYAAELRRRNIEPVMVVGFCSAAALSLLLVAELRRLGQ